MTASSGASPRPRVELICLICAVGVLAVLAVPREFASRALDGAAGTVATTSIALGLQTNEGALASAVATTLAGACAYALYARQPLPGWMSALFGLALGLAVLEVADLMSDLPRRLDPDSRWCANDPRSYYEPDLYEHFRELPDRACVYRLGVSLLPAAWLLLFAPAAMMAGVGAWRARWRYTARRAVAIVTVAVTVVVLVLGSAAAGLQHLE